MEEVNENNSMRTESQTNFYQRHKRLVLFGGGILLYMAYANLFAGPLEGRYTGYVVATETAYPWWGLFSNEMVVLKSDVDSVNFIPLCITDDSHKSLLEEKQDSREEVTVRYKNGAFMPAWECQYGVSVVSSVE